MLGGDTDGVSMACSDTNLPDSVAHRERIQAGQLQLKDHAVPSDSMVPLGTQLGRALELMPACMQPS